MNSSGTKDENKRIPMVWSKTDTTGMTKGPADMDAGIESPFPAEDEQEQDKDSILSYYKNALRLRNQNPEIARGTIEVCVKIHRRQSRKRIRTVPSELCIILGKEMIRLT